ncbi:hypothetical protein FGB62_35g225 [Gracilaria domingensis]|nr:hypothetical protein FGB62_35g225 [Gracilaria domingensis]
MSESIAVRNIRSGFARTELWVRSENGPSAAPLNKGLDIEKDENGSGLHLDELFAYSYTHIKGPHLSAEYVLAALELRAQNWRNTENAADLRHLIELAPRRTILRKHFRATREARPDSRRHRTTDRERQCFGSEETGIFQSQRR